MHLSLLSLAASPNMANKNQFTDYIHTYYKLTIVWNEAERVRLKEIITGIRCYKFCSAQIRHYLHRLEVDDSRNLQHRKTALLQTKEQRDEKGFNFLLELTNQEKT